MSVTYGDVMKADPSMLHKSAGAWKDWADAALVHAGYLKEQVGDHIEKQSWDGPPALMARGKVGGAHVDLTNSAGKLRSVETVLIAAGKAFDEAKNTLIDLTSQAKGFGLNVDGETGHLSYTPPAVGTTMALPTGGTTKMTQADVTNMANIAQGHINDLQPKIDAAVAKADRADHDVTQALTDLTPAKYGGNDVGGRHGGNPSGAGWNGDYGPSGAPPGGAIHPASGQVKAWIEQALEEMRKAGIDTSGINPDDIATIIQFESGGNPHAINLWDSNAAAGHPSKGLMQCIDSTFSAHALPGHGDIYNPVDNIIAGVRYSISRYGSVSNVPGIANLHHGGHYVGY